MNMRERIQFRELPEHRVWNAAQDPGSEGPPWWSGPEPAPKVGDRVRIILNGWKIGGTELEDGDIPGTVIGYRVDGGWLFAVVEADFAPFWYMKENGRVGIFAGRELEPLVEEDYP